MANRSRPSQLKRQRERAKAEKRLQKAARRVETKTTGRSGLEDISHIQLGPQPPLEPFDDVEAEPDQD